MLAVLVHLPAAVAEYQNNHRLCGGKALEQRRLYSPRTGISQNTGSTRRSCFFACADVVASLVSGEYRNRLHRARRWWVRGGAGYLPANSFVHIEHAHAFVDAHPEHQTGRAVAGKRFGIQNTAAYLDAYDAGAGACRSGPQARQYQYPKHPRFGFVGQALERDESIGCADGALVAGFEARDFQLSQICSRQNSMLNQAIVVHPTFCKSVRRYGKDTEMTLSRAWLQLGARDKTVVIKTMMRVFKSMIQRWAERAIKTISPASSANPFRAWTACKHQRLMAVLNRGAKRQDRRSRS